MGRKKKNIEIETEEKDIDTFVQQDYDLYDDELIDIKSIKVENLPEENEEVIVLKDKKESYYVKNKDLIAEIVKYKETFKKNENGKLIRSW